MARPVPRSDGATPASLEPAGDGRYALAGDLGFDDAARVLAAGEAAFRALPRAEVDLAGLARLDSAGLAVLLEWVLAARAAGRTVCYRNPPASVTALAGISDVAEMLVPDGGCASGSG